MLATESGAVELAPDLLVRDAERLRAGLERRRSDGALVLIGRRHLRSNNSWMHNLQILVKGKPRCTLQINPADAAELGVTNGGQAAIRSRVGEVTASVEVTDIVMPGVVSLPHGWGHDKPGAQMAVAAANAGVNSNVLTDPAVLDPLSGTAALNGIPVEVVPA